MSNGHTSALLISLPGNELVPWNRRLTRTGTARLKSLDFAKPTASPKQWQIPLTPADKGESIPTCAEAVVIALIEAYSLEPVVVACTLNLSVEQYPQGTVPAAVPAPVPQPGAISVQLPTQHGSVRLSFDGTASSDSAAVLDDPVSRWVALGDGRLSVELALPGSSPGLNVAFCPDTTDSRAILSFFCPRDETRRRLQQRLALLEHTMLEAIRTGEIPSAWEWAAINQLSKTHRTDAPTEDLNSTEGLLSLRGWEPATRLRAANQIWGPLDSPCGPTS